MLNQLDAEGVESEEFSQATSDSTPSLQWWFVQRYPQTLQKKLKFKIEQIKNAKQMSLHLQAIL